MARRETKTVNFASAVPLRLSQSYFAVAVIIRIILAVAAIITIIPVVAVLVTIVLAAVVVAAEC